MKALLYVLQHSFINYLKSFKKKPQKAIGPVFMIIFIFTLFLPRKTTAQAAEPSMGIVFVIGFTLLSIILLLYSIHKGTKKLKSYFLMSDVNFVFPAPIRPQTVLLYGLVKQITIEIFALFWFIYQIPNILSKFNVPAKNQIILIAAFILFQIVFCNCLKLMIFALCAKYRGLDRVIRTVIKLLSVSLVAVPGVIIYVNRDNLDVLEKPILNFYNSAAAKFIPVIGWMKELAYQSINGVNKSFVIYFILFIAFAVLMLYITYGIELDYYEDVLSMAEDNELINKIQSGEAPKGDLQYQRKAVKIFVNPLRRVRLKLNGAYGAKTFFYKHVNEYLKRGIFFINFYSIFLLAVSILYALTPVKEIKFLLFVFGGLLVYSSLGNKLQKEISYHYIYMIPDYAERKLFYGSISSLIKVFVDSLLLFVPSGIIMHSPALNIILCILTYVSLGVLCTFSGLFVFKLAGKLGLLESPVLFTWFFLLFQTLMLVPNVIIVLIITFTLRAFGGYALYIGMLFFNLVASTAFIYSCRGILDNMEQNSLY